MSATNIETALVNIALGQRQDDSNGNKSNYLTVATEQLRRGFKVTPVHPLEKRGVLHNQFKRPATTLSEVMQHAKDFADHNVGVVGVRGVGNHCFLDIDAEGVVELIEHGAGRQMPVTYAVQSSPVRKPWKRHYYFFQTEHSVATFKKQFNRRDTSKTVTSDKGTAMHPTMYDFKGVGAGGFVVAAGCHRKDGEFYTIMHDAPVIPIPDWMVDWLKSDQSGYMSECAKERRAQAEHSSRIPQSVRDVLRKEGEVSAFDIREVDIHDFMLWRAGSLASLGLERKTIERGLIELVRRFCAGGESYVKNHRGTIHSIAFSKKLRTDHVNARWFYRIGAKKKAALSIGEPVARQTRKGLLVEAMKTFPNRISSVRGYQRLQKALSGTDFRLDKGKVSQRVVSEVRSIVGFIPVRTPEGWVWVRSPSVKDSNTTGHSMVNDNPAIDTSFVI
jgi:bifunctional DNA primase/polymerase-like protein